MRSSTDDDDEDEVLVVREHRDMTSANSAMHMSLRLIVYVIWRGASWDAQSNFALIRRRLRWVRFAGCVCETPRGRECV